MTFTSSLGRPSKARHWRISQWSALTPRKPLMIALLVGNYLQTKPPVHYQKNQVFRPIFSDRLVRSLISDQLPTEFYISRPNDFFDRFFPTDRFGRYFATDFATESYQSLISDRLCDRMMSISNQRPILRPIFQSKKKTDFN